MKKVLAILCVFMVLSGMCVSVFATDEVKFYYSYGVPGVTERWNTWVDAEKYFAETKNDTDALSGIVELDEKDNVKITLTSKYFGQSVIEGSIRSDTYYLNGYELWTRRPFMIEDTQFDWENYTSVKKVYININVLNAVVGAETAGYSVITRRNGMSLNYPEMYFNIERPNMFYTVK